MSLGIAIGAITFSGSVIAFSKLQGLVSGDPITFPGQHLLNLALGLVAHRADRDVLPRREPAVVLADDRRSPSSSAS